VPLQSKSRNGEKELASGKRRLDARLRFGDYSVVTKAAPDRKCAVVAAIYRATLNPTASLCTIQDPTEEASSMNIGILATKFRHCKMQV
jgi:hypothetical protein